MNQERYIQQRFPMDKTAMMQEEWEKNCKRNKQEALTVRNDGTVNVSGKSPMTEVGPRYGVYSECGRRREKWKMRWRFILRFLRGKTRNILNTTFGVYDGHGCSHVAARCRERLHKLVQEELNTDGEKEEEAWKLKMERSFTRMDKEVVLLSESAVSSAKRKCELQTPDCDAVGSTAVVSIITPDKIVVASGDSRAVLCRNGIPVPLSIDHKPDRSDELDRIEGPGERVMIYWDCPRVLGRTDDDCLILASDGLWDVVPNETACSMARIHVPPWSSEPSR